MQQLKERLEKDLIEVNLLYQPSALSSVW